jgi:hypothetical protein
MLTGPGRKNPIKPSKSMAEPKTPVPMKKEKQSLSAAPTNDKLNNFVKALPNEMTSSAMAVASARSNTRSRRPRNPT